MTSWTGQDWALALGGVAVLLTSIGGFVTNILTAVRMKDVAHKVDGMLVQRDASNVAAGTLIGRAAGDEASAQREAGRREERELHRDDGLSANPNGVPVPVADDRTAIAAEKGAKATERIADAAETTAAKK